jgi:hypothetical protein
MAGVEDHSALRASPLRGRPAGVILPVVTRAQSHVSHPTARAVILVAGVEGSEPPYGGIKTRKKP